VRHQKRRGGYEEEEKDEKELVENADCEHNPPHDGVRAAEGTIPEEHGAHNDEDDNHGNEAPFDIHNLGFLIALEDGNV